MQQIAKRLLGILLIFSKKEETLSQFYENTIICRWLLDFLIKALAAWAGWHQQYLSDLVSVSCLFSPLFYCSTTIIMPPPALTKTSLVRR